MPIYYNDPRDLGNPMAQAGIAPPMYQRSPYATATVMAHPVMQAGDRGYYTPTGGAYPQYPYGAPYGPSVGFGVGTAPTWSVTPLTGYPSAYPHVLNGAVMAGEPFRMTQYFGPAYMPGFMDMMMARLLQGMIGGGRGGGGGGARTGRTAKTCSGPDCNKLIPYPDGMLLTGTPEEVPPAANPYPDGMLLTSTPEAVPMPYERPRGWPVHNAAPPLPGEALPPVEPRVSIPTPVYEPKLHRGVPGEGVLDFMQRQLKNAWNSF